MTGTLFVVSTPIGNLKDITLRALETLKTVDLIYCEDTRHSLKLLNHFDIHKPLRSCPHFKEKKLIDEVLDVLRDGKSIAYITDAGSPGICDPGSHLVGRVRQEGWRVEVIGGVSALTAFLAGAGIELESFRFVGFLPPRLVDRKRFFEGSILEPTIFFESPHRIEASLQLLAELKGDGFLILAKELSKISEAFFSGYPHEILKVVKSFKGEWIGMILPDRVKN